MSAAVLAAVPIAAWTGVLTVVMLLAACLLGLRTGPEPRSARADRPSMVRQIAEGLGYFRHGGFLPLLATSMRTMRDFPTQARGDLPMSSAGSRPSRDSRRLTAAHPADRHH